MFDSRIRPLIDPPLDRCARALAAAGVTANGLTIAGFVLGLAAATAIALGHTFLGGGLFLAGRLADGLDGPVSRKTESTDLGGYLDIVFDFAIYAAIPLAFALCDPSANALPAAFLLAAIVANGSAFLAFAVMAEKRALETKAQGTKSLYFLAGLAEGTETVAIYTAMCVWPEYFSLLAIAFASLCVASAVGRIALAVRALRTR